MNKLKNALTRRVLKLLEDESKKNPERYSKWYTDFNSFLKEGLSQDSENQEVLLRLMRFNATFAGSTKVSLEEYYSKMTPTQEKIYFIVSNGVEGAMSSPFMDPFKGTDVPVLVLDSNIDELVLTQIGKYREKKFVNIETNYDSISKDLGKVNDPIIDSKIPEDEIPGLSIWLKESLNPVVGKVQLSQRLKDAPAIITGQHSSSMRMMQQMI